MIASNHMRESIIVVASEKPADRRRQTRICVPFLARVEGTDADGHPVRATTVLDNLSVDGLYFRLMHRVSAGAPFRVVVFLAEVDPTRETPRVEIHGEVLRTEDRGSGVIGVALKVVTARFLWTRARSTRVAERARAAQYASEV